MQLAQVPANGYHLQSYGPEKFVVSGIDYPHALLIGDAFLALWQQEGEAITLASLAPLLDAATLDVLLVGTGGSMKAIPAALRMELRGRGITLDAMSTGAACRTYTILQSEGRRVGAALLLAR